MTLSSISKIYPSKSMWNKRNQTYRANQTNLIIETRYLHFSCLISKITFKIFKEIKLCFVRCVINKYITPVCGQIHVRARRHGWRTLLESLTCTGMSATAKCAVIKYSQGITTWIQICFRVWCSKGKKKA